MNLTRGERWAMVCYAVVLVGFIPGVWISAHVKTTVLGFPFPLFWAAAMVLTTAVMMSLAYTVKQRIDGEGSGGDAIGRGEDGITRSGDAVGPGDDWGEDRK